MIESAALKHGLQGRLEDKSHEAQWKRKNHNHAVVERCVEEILFSSLSDSIIRLKNRHDGGKNG